jgi:hypothetical protein
MYRLRAIIDKFGRWQPVEDYKGRIEAFFESDFSISIENAKSLPESIAKEICKERGQGFKDDDSPSKLLKLAFGCIGVQSSAIGPQIAVALENIGQHVGQLRNEVGAISHGRTMDELEAKKTHIDSFTQEFLINSTEIIACFLIEYFEWKYPRTIPATTADTKLVYEECDPFNEFWYDTYGEFEMGEYSFPASEILYNVDYKAYANEQKVFSIDVRSDENH